MYMLYIFSYSIQNKDLCRSKGKVRLCCLGTKFIQFHAMLAILHPDCWKNMMNSSFSSFILVQLIFFFIPTWCKIASAARNSVPHTEATIFALYSVYVHCTMYMLYIYSAADYTMIQITANENQAFSWFCVTQQKIPLYFLTHKYFVGYLSFCPRIFVSGASFNDSITKRTQFKCILAWADSDFFAIFEIQ